MKRLLLLSLLLSACVSGSLRTDPDLEEYPLRSATQSESKRLKRCMRAAHSAMERFKEQEGHYPKKARELPVDDQCQDFSLALQRTQEGYEVMAQFHENEQTVRWTVNQDGVIEEHLDQGDMDDLEL